MSDTPRIGIVGAGAWGTALAILANRAGNEAMLWTRNDHVASQIAKSHTNEHYLPEVFIDPAIAVTTDIARLSHENDVVVLCVPAQQMRPVCIMLSDVLQSDVPLVIASKGIECGSLNLMSEVTRATLPNNPVAVLSGPNFAREAACSKPTATTIASEDVELRERLIGLFGSSRFRPYGSDDIIGVQIGGAVKNVIAIACGIAMGRKLGENARAALITRALVEIMRLAEMKGGKAETLMGLSGMGDLLLTCSSDASRNTRLGIRLGEGARVSELSDDRFRYLAEGAYTAEAVYDMARKAGVSMPICFVVHRILDEQLTVDEAIAELLRRPFNAEGLWEEE